ncbi:MAG TPA: MotA/TolQ/ExbB proton channel family protein, partial [Pirellulales bacterium]|nr:MotA/TolQ/ExbB proton channel family protein [Pirellulales bacterium]
MLFSAFVDRSASRAYCRPRIALLAVAAAGWLLLGSVLPARAQDDLKEAQAAEGKPAGSSPAAATAAKPAAGASSDEARGETQLAFFYHALGVVYTIAFLLISFCFVALLVMNTLALRRDSICPQALVQGFEAHLNEKRYQEAYELAKQDESFLGRVLSAGLAKLSAGYSQAVESMQAVGEDETMRLEQRLSYIALIGTVAPMVGLLGTVDGMVE